MNALRTIIFFLFFLLLIALFSSCSTSFLTAKLIGPAMDNMQQQSDIELVCEGTPSFLLMIDSFILDDPENRELLKVGAKSYSGSIGAMMECGQKEKRLRTFADKGYHYGQRLLLQHNIKPEDSIEIFEQKLSRTTKKDSENLFWAAFSWITWVQLQQGAPEAMADIGKIELLLLRILELDETVQSGATHFLLGGYYGARPKILGGDPEKSGYHFQKSLSLSQRKMLMFQTTYAETLARLTFNQELHDALLKEVIDFDITTAPENTLANQIAKRRAQRLLDERFFE